MIETYVPHVGWLRSPNPDRVLEFLHEGWFEYRDQAFLWLYLRDGDTVIDCGAHLGLFSVLAGRLVGDRGRVIALEPNPELADALRSNLRDNEIQNAKVVEAAAYSTTGPLTLHVGERELSAYSSVHARPEGTSHDQTVAARTLDALLDEEGIGRADLLKLDVEGAEIDVLEGAIRSVEADRLPLVVMEFSEKALQGAGRSSAELAAAWEARGFGLYRFDPERCNLVAATVDGPIWYENLYATRDPEPVRRRLATATPERRRIACDVVARGAATARLNDERDDLRNRLAEQATIAESRGRSAEQLDSERREWQHAYEREHRQLEQRVAESHELQAGVARLQESIGELQKAVQDTATRLAEAESAQRGYAEQLAVYRERLKAILSNRWFRLASRTGLVKRPAWVDEVFAEPTGAPPTAGAHTDLMADLLGHLRDKGFRPDTVYDIGAAKGYWSVIAEHFFPSAHFELFEPLPENEPALAELCRNKDRFRFHLTALGEHVTTSWINVTEPASEGSSLLEYYRDEGQKRVEIRVCRLDALLDDGGVRPPDLVKIDVQGFELNVLRGGENALRRAECLIVEVNLFKFMPECPRAHEVVGFLAERGFYLYDVAGMLRRPFQNDLGQMDLVFVRSDSPLIADSRWT